MKCDYCGSNPNQLTVWRHPSGATLQLCFHGCQHFPEPYRATGLTDEWVRTDPWIRSRPQPRLRHTRTSELQLKLQL